MIPTAPIGRDTLHTSTAAAGAPSAIARRVRIIAILLALVFAAAHLPFLASTLEDIDSINFALGIREFDPPRHRPHPPGYPFVIGLGKLGTFVATGGGPVSDAPAASIARALSFWSVVFGALAILPLAALFRRLTDLSPPRGAPARWWQGSGSTALLAVSLAMACPLYWFTALRPLSDLPGLAAALAAQALLVAAFAVQRAARREQDSASPARLAESGRLIVAGAFAAGLALGFRSQTAWLTVGPFVVVLLDRAGRGAAAALLGSAVTFTAGVLVWAIPLLAGSGGVGPYLSAVMGQAAEDFSGVDMFLNFPSVRRMAFGLLHTFVLPWGSTPAALIVLAFAAIGSAVMLVRERAALLMLAAIAVPYAAFHLLVHETVTTRYALPLVPVVAYLAVRGFRAIPVAGAPAGVAVLVAWSMSVAVPAMRPYSSSGAPLFAALAGIERAAGEERVDRVAFHHVFARGVEAAAGEARVLPAPPGAEWLQLVKYWKEGGRGPVWFLADRRRTDLALVDPAARQVIRRYDWPFRADLVMSGARPGSLDWLEIRDPGWLLSEGWAMTPETAGVATARRQGLSAGPIEAVVRRRGEPAVLMIGGRDFDGTTASLEIAVDGRVLGVVDVPASAHGATFFLRMLTLPEGVPASGEYGVLQVRAVPRAGRGPANLAVEQFDLQPVSRAMVGYDTGWHEPEADRWDGTMWRWTSERSTLLLHAGEGDCVLRLEGESPRRYFGRGATVVVRGPAGELGRFTIDDDFSIDVPVPRQANDPSLAVPITIETDLTFVPDEREHNGDRRRLGLRVFRVSVAPANRPRR